MSEKKITELTFEEANQAYTILCQQLGDLIFQHTKKMDAIVEHGNKIRKENERKDTGITSAALS
jgi:hypothetical protein